MNGLSDHKGRAVIALHFPDADPAHVERHAIWLSPPQLTRLPPFHFAKAGDDFEAKIDDFQRALGEAWEAYSALPLFVRSKSGVDWVAFAKLVRSSTGRAVVTGQSATRPTSVRIMRANLAKAERLSAQAWAADHPAKVALVERARAAWRDFTGGDAPVKPSEGSPFYRFVSDLIAYSAGLDWGPDKALAAWRTAHAKTDG